MAKSSNIQNIKNEEKNTENEKINKLEDEKKELLKQIEELKKINSEEKKEGTYTVYTPSSNFNGIIAGVHFAYGKAIVNDGWILKWFKERGYRIEEN